MPLWKDTPRKSISIETYIVSIFITVLLKVAKGEKSTGIIQMSSQGKYNEFLCLNVS